MRTRAAHCFGVSEEGRDLRINMRWGERGGRGKIGDNDDHCRRGGAAWAKIGKKVWQGDAEGDDCVRVSHFFIAQELHLTQ